MNLAGLIGEKANGDLENVCDPSRDIPKMIAEAEKQSSDDKYVRVYLFDAGRHPMVCTKCVKKTTKNTKK